MATADSVTKFFELGNSTAEAITHAASKLSIKNEADFNYKLVMFFFFCKTYKSFQALKQLWNAGFPEDTMPILRSMFEGMLQVQHIRSDPPRAEIFLDSDAYQRYDLYQKIKKAGILELATAIENRGDDFNFIRDEYARVKGKFRPGQKWWGNSIKWLAEQHNQLLKYYTVYWIESNFVHSGVGVMSEFIRNHTEGLRVNCYPNRVEDPDVPMEAALYLIGISDWTQQALELDLNDAMLEALERFGEVATTVKDAI